MSTTPNERTQAVSEGLESTAETLQRAARTISRGSAADAVRALQEIGRARTDLEDQTRQAARLAGDLYQVGPTQAAKALGINASTVWRWINQERRDPADSAD